MTDALPPSPVCDVVLPISVATEYDPLRTGVSAPELEALITALGPGLGEFAVVTHLDGDAQRYIQTWRGGPGPYVVEYRDGGPEQHFGTLCENAEQVLGLLLGWVQRLPQWSAGYVWEQDLVLQDADGGRPEQDRFDRLREELFQAAVAELK